MVEVIFCAETSRHFNYSVSNQHWTSSITPLQWIKCAEQIYIDMLKLSYLHQLKFLRTYALQSSPMKFYFWYLSCKHFPEITHQYILFAPSFFTWNILKQFELLVLQKIYCWTSDLICDIPWYSNRKPVIFPTH